MINSYSEQLLKQIIFLLQNPPSSSVVLGSVDIDQTTPGTTNGVVVNSITAGSNIIGKVTIDQTTPGTTNAIALSTLGANAIAVGNGASSTGVLRVAQVNDGTGVLAQVTLVPTVTTVSTLTSGNVGGFTTVVSSSIVMSVPGVYASADYMGTTTTPQSFTNVVRTSGGTGIIKSIAISDKITTTNVAMELWLFSATFVAPTDNAAWAISDAESLTVLGVIPIAVAGWYASANNQTYFDGTLSIPIKPTATSLFYALVARGTTPSFASLDLQLTLGILQD